MSPYCLPKLFLVIIVLFILPPVCLSLAAPEVRTWLGKIRGRWEISYDGKLFAAFEGIPYAKPPVGDLRFEEPQTTEPWKGILIAKKLYTCIQFNKKVVGTEDCLYLNVYVPGDYVDHKKIYPVVVIVPSVDFMTGSGHATVNPKFVMDREMIVVTFNYRMGPFGFLSTADEEIPGNNGLKDQVLAMKWVKLNVASFGGNPNAVTAVGHSAGGASVHLHYFSPLSKGLFARGMSQGGTALDPWVIRKYPFENARKLADSVGCKQPSSQEMKKCLKKKSAGTIADQVKNLLGYGKTVGPFGPVVESKSKHPFLARTPYSMLKDNNVLDVPWITSTCTHGGLLPAIDYYRELDKIDRDWPETAHYLMVYNSTIPKSRRKYVANEIKKKYLDGQKFSKKTFVNVTKLFTERLFTVGAEISAKLQSEANKSPVYYYLFNYADGENSVARNKSFPGVAHLEDAVFFYGAYVFRPFSEEDKKLRDTCLDILYSYASTGNPAFGRAVLWKPLVDSSELVYLNITSSESVTLHRTRALSAAEFWTKLGFSEEPKHSFGDEL